MSSQFSEEINQPQAVENQSEVQPSSVLPVTQEEGVPEQEDATATPAVAKTGWAHHLRQRVFAGRRQRLEDQQPDMAESESDYAIQERRQARTRDDAFAEVVRWNKRRDLPLTILAWAGVLYLVLIVAQHIITTLLLLIVAAVLAFALVPAVSFFQRWMPRVLAILLVYILVLGGLGSLIYFIAISAIDQVNLATAYLSTHNWTDFLGFLGPLGITQQQVQVQLHNVQTQVLTQAKDAASSAVPLLAGFFDSLLNIVLVAVLSIYFLIDGERMVRWLRHNAPQSIQSQTGLTLDTINRIVGGYIRGQLFLCALIGVLVGIVLTIFHVPYALLLGVLAFFLEFVPILGTLISGVICVLLALTQGWLIAVLVLACFIGLHILEGDVIGPRIVGKAIGLHPIVSIAALIAGSELFGIWGALFASPVAGVLQSFLIVIWLAWRSRHPRQFQTRQEKTLDNAAEQIVVQSPLAGAASHPQATEAQP